MAIKMDKKNKKTTALFSAEALEAAFSRMSHPTGALKRRLRQTICDALKPENDPRFLLLCQNIAETIHQVYPQCLRNQTLRTLTKRGKPRSQGQAARSERPTAG